MVRIWRNNKVIKGKIWNKGKRNEKRRRLGRRSGGNKGKKEK